MNNEQEKLNTTPDEVAKLEAEFASKRRTNTRRRAIFRASVITLLVAVLVAIIYFAVSYGDRFSPENLRQYVSIRRSNSINTLGGAADIVGGNSSVYANFADGLALATTTSVRYSTPDGKDGFSEKAVLAEPSVSVNGNYLLAYDRSGTDLMLFDDGGLLSAGQVAGDIVSASVSKGGIVSVISEAEGYISCLTVFNSDFELVYRWHNSEYYCVSSAYHDDSKSCAVNIILEENGVLTGGVLIFDTTAEGIAHSIPLGNAVPRDIWATDAGFTTVSGDSVSLVDTAGTLYVSHGFTEGIHGISPDGNGGLFILLAPYSPGRKYELIHMEADGLLSRRVAINEDIHALHAADGHFAILTGKNVAVYNTILDVERIISQESDIINIAVIRDGLVVLFSRDGLKVS